MPTYEYACDNCGGEFEIFQSIKDAPVTVCEKCGGKLTKLLSAGTGLIFKGSGFYITDYKSKTGGESSGSSASGGSSSGDSGAASSASSATPAAAPGTGSGSTSE